MLIAETDEPARTSTAASKRRPKWALTEGEASHAEEKEEEKEVSDLLDFAKGLDFDRWVEGRGTAQGWKLGCCVVLMMGVVCCMGRYMDDLEVRAMMEQVAKRIKELELSTARDAADDKAAAVRQQQAWKEKLSIAMKPRPNQEDSDDDEVGVGGG